MTQKFLFTAFYCMHIKVSKSQNIFLATPLPKKPTKLSNISFIFCAKRVTRKITFWDLVTFSREINLTNIKLLACCKLIYVLFGASPCHLQITDVFVMSILFFRFFFIKKYQSKRQIMLPNSDISKTIYLVCLNMILPKSTCFQNIKIKQNSRT